MYLNVLKCGIFFDYFWNVDARSFAVYPYSNGVEKNVYFTKHKTPSSHYITPWYIPVMLVLRRRRGRVYRLARSHPSAYTGTRSEATSAHPLSVCLSCGLNRSAPKYWYLFERLATIYYYGVRRVFRNERVAIKFFFSQSSILYNIYVTINCTEYTFCR